MLTGLLQDDWQVKYFKLVDIIKSYKSVIAAFSGGVDSTLLMYAIRDAGIEAISVTFTGVIFPSEDVEIASCISKQLNIVHIAQPIDVLYNDLFVSNPYDRCYHCKKMIIQKLIELKNVYNLDTILEASNADDLVDTTRHGVKALKEYGINSPLAEAGLTKLDVRKNLKNLQFPEFDKPSSACLASRIPYETVITEMALKRVYLSEKAMKQLGFSVCRVRDYGHLAKIELSEGDLNKLTDYSTAQSILIALKTSGYRHVAIDIEPYRSGKLSD